MSRQTNEITIGDTGYRVSIDKHGNHEAMQWHDARESINIKGKPCTIKAGWKHVGHYGSMKAALVSMAHHSAAKKRDTIQGYIEALNEFEAKLGEGL